MTRAWSLVVVALLAGCDPIYEADFTVTEAGGGEPVAGASIALVDCANGWRGEATLTDASGEAIIAGLGFTLPDCHFVVAKPGYRPLDSSFMAVCGCDLDDCYRVRDVLVELEPHVAE